MIERIRHALHRRRHPARYAQFDALLATIRMDRDALLDKQRQDFSRIVAFAAANTAYYGKTLAPLSSPDSLDPGQLPILTKQDVVSNLDKLLARNADRSQAKIGHTGGSTGTPLAFWYDDAKHELMRAGMMRSYTLSGWRPGQKILNFWGARQDVVAGGVFGTQVGDVIAAELTIAAFEYTEARLLEWARFIQHYRPVLLQGYASVLADVARVVIDHKLRMPDTLLGVYSTAEVLTDLQRQRMMQAFGCKVYNQYGSREIPNIACECALGKLHVFTDMVLLESVPENNENHLLVTSLTNRLMPMLRYAIGDTGRLLDGACACGLAFPLMEMDVCRQNDLIRTQHGKTFHPAYFNQLLYGLKQIRHYQWEQQAPDRLRLRFVASAPLNPDVIAALLARLRTDVDPQLGLEVERVDSIASTVSGKHRFVLGLS